jgi:hypothetical protein
MVTHMRLRATLATVATWRHLLTRSSTHRGAGQQQNAGGVWPWEGRQHWALSQPRVRLGPQAAPAFSWPQCVCGGGFFFLAEFLEMPPLNCSHQVLERGHISKHSARKKKSLLGAEHDIGVWSFCCWNSQKCPPLNAVIKYPLGVAFPELGQ